MKNTIVTAIISVGLLTGCNNPQPSKDTNEKTKPASTQQASTISVDGEQLPIYKVATLDTYPPFATADEFGVPTGLDIDLMKAIAKNQGFQPQFVAHDWSEWKSDLTKDKVDIWIGGITIKEKRKELVLYSDPYMNYYTAILTRDDDESNNINKETLQEYRLGAENETTSLATAKILNTNADKVKGFGSHFTAIQALEQKKIDAVIGNNIVLASITQSFPEFGFKFQNLSEKGTPPKQLGIMVKKDRNELAEKLNAGLKTVKANGEFDEIKKKWLGDSSN